MNILPNQLKTLVIQSRERDRNMTDGCVAVSGLADKAHQEIIEVFIEYSLQSRLAVLCMIFNPGIGARVIKFS